MFHWIVLCMYVCKEDMNKAIFSLAETNSLGGSKEDKCFILGVGGHVSLYCQHAAVVTRGAK